MIKELTIRAFSINQSSKQRDRCCIIGRVLFPALVSAAAAVAVGRGQVSGEPMPMLGGRGGEGVGGYNLVNSVK